MRTFLTQIVSSTAMSTNISSSGYDITYTTNFAVQANATGGPKGTFSLLASVDGVNFVTIPNTPTVIAGPGTTLWNIQEPGYKYVQLQFASTGAGGTSGSLSAFLMSKSWATT